MNTSDQPPDQQPDEVAAVDLGTELEEESDKEVRIVLTPVSPPGEERPRD